MESITVPPPEELQRRIESCEAELRELRRVFRLSKAMQLAEDARQQRQPQGSEQLKGVTHG
jgi:hypothetical protein